MISERIKKIREQNGMTQTELAKKLGITRSSVNAWEMGISVPSTQYLVELSHLFNVTTDHLLELDNDTKISIGNLDEDEKEIIFGLLKKFDQNKRYYEAVKTLSEEDMKRTGLDLTDISVRKKLGLDNKN